VQVDLTYVDLRADDTLLICSDGLSGMVRGEDIRGVLTELEEPSDVCAKLIGLANEAGGHDNVTVVIVKFGGAGLSEASPEDDAVSYRKYSLAAGEGSLADEAAPSERSAFRDTAKLPLSRSDLAAKEEVPEDKAPISSRPSLLTKATPVSVSEEVAVHMEGLPPRTVGAIIMAGVTLIIVMGFYLLR